MTNESIEDRCEITAVKLEGNAIDYVEVDGKMYKISTSGDVTKFLPGNPENLYTGYIFWIKHAIRNYGRDPKQSILSSVKDGEKKTYPSKITIKFSSTE